jgi:hypothetical protein
VLHCAGWYLQPWQFFPSVGAAVANSILPLPPPQANFQVHIADLIDQHPVVPGYLLGSVPAVVLSSTVGSSQLLNHFNAPGLTVCLVGFSQVHSYTQYISDCTCCHSLAYMW